jgi:hypothetical protein
MQYNRKETFRHTFENPIPATFQLIVESDQEMEVELSKKGACLIVDLSPSGIRIFSTLDIPKRPGYPIHLAIEVLLTDTPFKLVGVLIWKKAYMDGHQYGIDLKTDEKIEYKITRELKERRRLELIESKKSNKQ